MPNLGGGETLIILILGIPALVIFCLGFMLGRYSSAKKFRATQQLPTVSSQVQSPNIASRMDAIEQVELAQSERARQLKRSGGRYSG